MTASTVLSISCTGGSEFMILVCLMLNIVHCVKLIFISLKFFPPSSCFHGSPPILITKHFPPLRIFFQYRDTPLVLFYRQTQGFEPSWFVEFKESQQISFIWILELVIFLFLLLSDRWGFTLFQILTLIHLTCLPSPSSKLYLCTCKQVLLSNYASLMRRSLLSSNWLRRKRENN